MGGNPQGFRGEAIEPGSCVAGIRPEIQCQSTGRNRAAWFSISDFLSRQNLTQVLKARAAGARAHAGVSAGAGATAAVFQTLPDGNHGENFSMGHSV